MRPNEEDSDSDLQRRGWWRGFVDTVTLQVIIDVSSCTLWIRRINFTQKVSLTKQVFIIAYHLRAICANRPVWTDIWLLLISAVDVAEPAGFFCKGGKCDKMFPLSWLWAANCFVGIEMAGLFPIAHWWSLFLKAPFLSRPPKNFRRGWQQEAIRITPLLLTFQLIKDETKFPQGSLRVGTCSPGTVGYIINQCSSLVRLLADLWGQRETYNHCRPVVHLPTISNRNMSSCGYARHWDYFTTKTISKCPLIYGIKISLYSTSAWEVAHTLITHLISLHNMCNALLFYRLINHKGCEISRSLYWL